MAAFKKRKMERYAMEIPVLLGFETENGKQASLKLHTRNISAGGAYLNTTTQALPIGTAVKLNLILPLKKNLIPDVQQTHIAVTGNVVRTDKKGMAICFDDKYQISAIMA